jgi:hypothetical protein
MRVSAAVSFVLLGVAGSAPAQQHAEIEGARELFYKALVEKDSPPPVRRASTRSTPAAAEAVHLGLRYNLVLVDANSGASQPAAPDRTFRAGECFAIDFETNRSGFLYVLAKQSSGAWQMLVPSADPDMATESNVIVPGKKVRVPLQHCFEIRNPPGVETLFVVLSREPRDSFELYENLKSPAAAPSPDSAPPADAPKRRAPATQVADASVTDGTISRMREQFGTRDIAIRKVNQPLEAAEPPGSVYVVNASVNPSSNIAAQIEVRHR